MNNVRVDKEKMVGYIEGGSTVHHVVQELFKQGKQPDCGLYGTGR